MRIQGLVVPKNILSKFANDFGAIGPSRGYEAIIRQEIKNGKRIKQDDVVRGLHLDDFEDLKNCCFCLARNTEDERIRVYVIDPKSKIIRFVTIAKDRFDNMELRQGREKFKKQQHEIRQELGNRIGTNALRKKLLGEETEDEEYQDT